MAIPVDSRAINQVVASTREAVRPVVVDALYKSNPLLARLLSKDKVVLAGGEEIRVPFMYDELPGGWYSGLDAFTAQAKEIITDLRFDWKQVYASVTLPSIDVAKNMAPHRLFDIVAAQFSGARMTLSKKLGTELYNLGTDVNRITGLRLAISTTGTYGKITRGSDVIGTAIKAGLEDTTGGSVTVPMINDFMGQASAGGAEKQDLLLSTQLLWDALWARVQPKQYYQNPGGADTANMGFAVLKINGADVVADSYCPVGFIFGVNTNYIEFYVMDGYDFYVRGPFELHGQDGFTAQVVTYCELAIQNPRLCFSASGLTA